MSWNVLLEPTLPPCFTVAPKPQSPTVALRCPQAAKITPKTLPIAGACQVNPAPIPCIWLAAIQKRMRR